MEVNYVKDNDEGLHQLLYQVRPLVQGLWHFCYGIS